MCQSRSTTLGELYKNRNNSTVFEELEVSIVDLMVANAVLLATRSGASETDICDRQISNTDIFRIGPIPVSPITTRSESSRHFDNCKGKSRDIGLWWSQMPFYWRREAEPVKLIFATVKSTIDTSNSSNTIVLLRDVFHIGLVIGPRSAVLAWGAAQICQYNIKTFIGPIRQKSVQYGYFSYWPNSSQSNNN
jgi:hypothetical protein